MSRAIGFRAWDNANNEWLNKEDAECLVIYLDGRYEIDRGWVKVFPDLTIEQDTGLKDKNGKKIYENDIIKDTSDGDCLINAVFWCEKGGFWGVKPRSPFAERDWGWFIGRDNIEVIGNVHENKELLEGGE